jgi:hypothetical protein
MLNKKGKSIKQLINIVDYDFSNDCYITKSGYMDILQIRSKDIVNSNDDDIEYDVLKFAKLYKLYSDDIKIVALNFPCNTDKQQDFIRHKIKMTQNTLLRDVLQKKLNELVWIGKNDTTREYYFIIYGKNIDNIEKNRLLLCTTLDQSKNGLVILINKEKKDLILIKMANKSVQMGGWNR